MRNAALSFAKALMFAVLFYVVFMVLVVILEFANGIRSFTAAVETGMGAWLVYWYPWHPLLLLILLWATFAVRMPPIVALPTIAIALSLVGANLRGYNLAFYFGVSFDPLIYIGLGWLSLAAAMASVVILRPIMKVLSVDHIPASKGLTSQ
jgi:hypothetical protein